MKKDILVVFFIHFFKRLVLTKKVSFKLQMFNYTTTEVNDCVLIWISYSFKGNTYDLSGPVLGRAMFHSDNAYWVPNMRVRGRIAKTNTISNTAFRGFGGRKFFPFLFPFVSFLFFPFSLFSLFRLRQCRLDIGERGIAKNKHDFKYCFERVWRQKFFPFSLFVTSTFFFPFLFFLFLFFSLFSLFFVLFLIP